MLKYFRLLCLCLLCAAIMGGTLCALQFAPVKPVGAGEDGGTGTEQSVTASLTLYCGDMTTPYLHDGKIAAGGSMSYTLDAQTLLASLTMALTSHTLDFTTRAVYWPLWWPRFNAGLGAVFHFKSCEDIFNETDVLLGGWTRWRGRVFEVNGNVDYMIKSARIHAIDDYLPRLVNHSMAVGLQMKWHIVPWRVSVWGGLSSWCDTSFMLFFAPRWSAGAEWEVVRGRFVGIEATAVYIDQATLSAYCEGTEVRCFVRIHRD